MAKHECKSKFAWIIDKYNEQIEKDKEGKEYPRYYLGASLIGDDCKRKIWYDFRHAKKEKLRHFNIKAIEAGHEAEDKMAYRLNRAGFNLQVKDQYSDKQIGFSDLGGWFRGHLDGVFQYIEGLGVCIWEAKATEKWQDLDKLIDKHGEENALMHWNKTYYTQAQIYMGALGVEHHLLMASNAGATKETIVYTKFDKEFYERTKEKGNNIICTDHVPEREYNSEENFKCKYMCNSVDVCWKGHVPKPNCRNCAYISFKTEGYDKPTAICDKHKSAFPDMESMTQFYNCHRFNPSFLEGSDLIQIKENGDTVYKHKVSGVEFVNGEQGFNSLQMYETNNLKPWLDNNLNKIAKDFGIENIHEET